MVKLKKIVIISICITLLLSVYNFNYYSAYANSGIPKGYIKAAETDALILLYNNQPSIAIMDKRNGYIWSSSMDEDKYETENINQMWRNTMQSLFRFNYTDITGRREHKILSLPSYGSNSNVSINPVNDGLEIKYTFTQLEIEINLRIQVNGNELYVSIPEDGIKELGKYVVVSIEIMPFFGAADDNTDGYILCPDGCGALYRFNDVTNKGINDRLRRWYVYGNENSDVNYYERIMRQEMQQAMMPVFGIKKGDNSIFAIIENGEYDAAVNFSPSGYAVALSRISAEFTLRHTYTVIGSDIKISDGRSIEKVTFKRVHNEAIKTERGVRYSFLYGNSSNYSGMANYYRNYLLEREMLRKTIADGEDIPLSLDLFMGIEEERLLINKFIPMTTFDQAISIIDEFEKSGVGKFLLNIVGWNSRGYGSYPKVLPPARQLGGWQGLKKLVDFTNDKGYRTYLQINIFDALSKIGGFSLRNDVAKYANNIIITNERKTSFLLNPYIASKRFESTLSDITDRGININGFSFEKLGYVLYEDHHKKYPSRRNQTAHTWLEVINKSASITGSASVHGGNTYILKSVDRLYNIPVNNSNYHSLDEAVPFYQMVIHGCIPYSSEPANIFYDFDKQKLIQIEYGCLPHFELTYEKAELMINTGYNRLFSSCYSDWKDIVIGVYNEFNNKLRDTYSAFMISHEYIEKGICRIEYDNGCIIYINYNTYPVFVEQYEIKSEDYIVIDGGGKVQ